MLINLNILSHRGPKQTFWWVQCSHCGKKFTQRQNRLHQESCGCIPTYFKHGHDRRNSRTPELRTYHHMIERCYNPNCKEYPNWGGRGIKVCDRWLESFTNFHLDMGDRPTGDRYSLDRIDNNKDYSPENCRWANQCTQGRNTTKNRRITIAGHTALLVEWTEILDVSRWNVYHRIETLTEADRLLAPYGVTERDLILEGGL